MSIFVVKYRLSVIQIKGHTRDLSIGRAGQLKDYLYFVRCVSLNFVSKSLCNSETNYSNLYLVCGKRHDYMKSRFRVKISNVKSVQFL
jgi:hypothetical protein